MMSVRRTESVPCFVTKSPLILVSCAMQVEMNVLCTVCVKLSNKSRFHENCTYGSFLCCVCHVSALQLE